MTCPVCDTDLDQFDKWKYEYEEITCPECKATLEVEVDWIFDEERGDEFPERHAKLIKT